MTTGAEMKRAKRKEAIELKPPSWCGSGRNT
jgi:hypothetical protein